MKRFLVVAVLLVAGVTAASVQADHGRYRSVYSGGHHHHHGSSCGGYRSGYGGYGGYGGWSGGGYYVPAPVYSGYYGGGYGYGGGGYGYGVPVYGTGMTIVRPGVSFSYWR